ncbi:hypothetical protein NDS46_26360 [Paenibacillus thiaminolyticus]|uniref:hypothetical protein n=1 Tax=Paenibacillus thiaminolyticus TaxID=49283 RepID=UPI002330621D|nr:hypothetical protein [Paenibacillus thiaminolyticus]WCF07771.1 hypothetical protein NDS46_26360 [Paenibacillus thiaminolyticus]
MKKSLVIISTVLMLSTFTGFASAAPDSTRIAPTQSETLSIETDYEPGDVHHVGYDSFQRSFTANIHAGRFMDIYVKNDGPGTVYMTLIRDGKNYAVDIPISSGQQKTETIGVLGGIINEKWEVSIKTKDGHNMDFQFKIRQYRNK